MSKYIRKFETLNRFILPAIPSLTTMTKLNSHTELDKSILDKCVICFYNILITVKVNKFYEADVQVWDSIIKYGLLDNLVDLVVSLMSENSSDQININSTTSNRNSKNSVINLETFKSIVKIFQLLSEQSAKICNSLINMNILEMVHKIFKEELELSSINSQSIEKGRAASTHHSIFNELLPLLISFFPSTFKEDDSERLITDNTSLEYISFSKNIIPVLIENFINISSSQTSLKALRLINI